MTGNGRDKSDQIRQLTGPTRAEPRTTGDISRREALAGLGVLGAAGLAGCTGSSGDGAGGNGSQSGGDGGSGSDGDSSFTVSLPITNPDINFNEFNFANYSWDLTSILFDPLAKWNPSKNEYVPVLLDSWEIGEKSITLHIQDGYTWHEGSPVTAADAVASLRLEKDMGWSVSEYAKSIEKTGQLSLRMELKDRANKRVIEHELLGGTWINKPPHVYEEWMGRFRKASSESERSKIREDLAKKTITDPFGYGPLEVTNIGERQLTMKPFDDHPQGGKMNFDEYVVKFIGTNQKVWQAMRSDNLDGVPSVFAPNQVVQGLPDHWMQTKHSSFGGYGVTFNHEHPAFGDRAVRQAIAHVVDRKTVAQNSGSETKVPVKMVTGAAPQSNKQWFQKHSDTFTDYGVDRKRAAELMRQAGYEKQNGVWTGENGPLRPTFIAPSGWGDWVTASKTVSNQLRSFGIETQLSTMEHATYESRFGKGNFDLAADGWGGGPYPLFAFQTDLKKEARKKYNYPAKVTVPAMNGSGKTTVNIPELMQTINSSGEKDEKRLTRLAWMWNQDLPALPIQTTYEQSFITTDGWKIPSKDAPVMSIDDPPTYLPKVGELREA